MATLNSDGPIETADGNRLYGDGPPTVQDVLELVRSFSPAAQRGFIASGAGAGTQRSVPIPPDTNAFMMEGLRMMRQTLFFDEGDAWHVVADYSGSPRHAAMTETQWKEEFTGTAYDSMRRPGLMAGLTPRGLGRWTKDWSTKVATPASTSSAGGCCK